MLDVCPDVESEEVFNTDSFGETEREKKRANVGELLAEVHIKLRHPVSPGVFIMVIVNGLSVCMFSFL